MENIHECACGEEISGGRYALGYRVCLDCGSSTALLASAEKARSIVPAGHKQGPTYISPERRKEHVQGLFGSRAQHEC